MNAGKLFPVMTFEVWKKLADIPILIHSVAAEGIDDDDNGVYDGIGHDDEVCENDDNDEDDNDYDEDLCMTLMTSSRSDDVKSTLNSLKYDKYNTEFCKQYANHSFNNPSVNLSLLPSA